MVVMLHGEIGGYDTHLGWTGNKGDRIDDVPRAGRGRALRDDERTEMGSWVHVSVHLDDARREAERLCDHVTLHRSLRTAVIEAAGLHDLGKLHPGWQQAIPAIPPGTDGRWAKFPRVLAVDVTSEGSQTVRDHVAKRLTTALPLPDGEPPRASKSYVRLRWATESKLKREELDALKKLGGVRWAGHAPFRPRMRHEAASALAMWARYREGRAAYPALSVYLVAAHHGKVRTILRATTDSGDDTFGISSDPAALDVMGEQWPLDFSVTKDGAEGEWSDGAFVLTGYGWTGLVADLLGPWRPEDAAEVGVVPDDEPRRLGPFALAYLEALVRVVDWRATDNPSTSLSPSEVSRVR
jgi:CRISPR-associated endonuclease/helicase Cas3